MASFENLGLTHRSCICEAGSLLMLANSFKVKASACRVKYSAFYYSLGGLSEKVESITIRPVFEKSNAMIYAYLRGLTPVTGEDYSPYFKKHQVIKKLGRKLYKYLEEKDRGFAQDIETINAWAEILGIDGWFEWIGFEDVPESYYE